MFRRTLIKKYITPPNPPNPPNLEIYGLFPLFGIIMSAIGIMSYSIYKHVQYDSDYYLSYSKRKNIDNQSDFGIKTDESLALSHKEIIQNIFTYAKQLKNTFPCNLIFNNEEKENTEN